MNETLSKKRKKLREQVMDSKFITYWEEVFDIIESQDREFIQKLKEKVPQLDSLPRGDVVFMDDVIEEIDKLAGEELIK